MWNRAAKIGIIVNLFFIHPSCNAQEDVKTFLSTINQNDILVLNRIFYEVMENDHFSYSLFGDKPISLSAYSPTISSENFYGFSEPGITFKHGWSVWEKYSQNFPIKNYLLIKEPSATVLNSINIVFINKKAFLEEVNKHLALFKMKLGEHTTAENLLKKIEDSREFVNNIKNDEVLWGILLGYGVHNANLYDRELKLEKFLFPERYSNCTYNTAPLFPFSISSAEEELKFIESEVTLVGEYGYSPIIQTPVHFRGDLENPETKSLVKKYENLRGKISSIYAQGDFLEITLSKLVSEDF